MKNKLLILLSLAFFIGAVGCTTKKVDQSNADADAAELVGDSSGSDTAGSAKNDSQAPSDIDADFGADESNKTAANTNADAGAQPPTGGDDLAGLDDSSTQAPPPAGEEPKPVDQLATNDAATTPPAETTAPSDAAATTPPATDETQGLTAAALAEAPKPVIPLQKMATAPFTKGGVLANAIYVSRPGDTLKSISKKIYGQDKVAELKKANPNLAKRKLKVGDKVYFNSPQRPTDNTQMLTYYEDKGLAPEVYLAQAGDDFKKVGKKLLGDSNSWKELWATNLDVESKTELAEGTRLRYWSNEPAPTEAAPVQDLVSNSAPAPTAQGKVAAPPMPDKAPPSEPPAAQAAVEPPPPPPPAPTQASAELPPPPPPAQAAPMPPPPKKAPKGPVMDKGEAEDPDQMMALGVGVILILAAAALVIIIRKKRAKRAVDFQTATHTQIE
jgi:hypothetical protein